jgi:myosin heavy subunit
MESFIRNGIIPRIGDERLQKLDTEMMQDLQNDIRRHYSARIVNEIMGRSEGPVRIVGGGKWNRKNSYSLVFLNRYNLF